MSEAGTISFYRFMNERELIRLRRLRGLEKPWTQDRILRTYSFTNVKRSHDRTSMAFQKIYQDTWGGKELHIEDHYAILATCAMYRYFGTEKAAEILGTVGSLQAQWNEKLDWIKQNGRSLPFTGAYIVPNCGDSRSKYLVVADILERIGHRLQGIVDDMAGSGWQAATANITKCIGVGSFMAKEVLLDYVMATGKVPGDWTTWTPVGPGARRGAARVLSGGLLETPGGLTEPKALELIRTLWARRRDYWPAVFVDDDGHSYGPSINLDLTDIQFQLCEFDKYNRAFLGEGKPKKLFRPKKTEVK